jgi:hypothetical protein
LNAPRFVNQATDYLRSKVEALDGSLNSSIKKATSQIRYSTVSIVDV